MPPSPTTAVLDALAAAFLDVGVVVALVAAVTAVLGGRVERLLELLRRRPAGGPLAGTALGLLPGCGGALVVAPLYLTGRVGRGTLVATLLATTGDSAFALWAGAPRTALLVHAVLVPLALGAGVATDRWWPAPDRPHLARATPRDTPAAAVAAAASGTVAAPRRTVVTASRPAGVVVGGFWACVAAGALAGLTLLVPAGAAAAGAGTASPVVAATPGTALSPSLVVGLLGTAVCVVLALRARGRFPVEGTPVPPTGCCGPAPEPLPLRLERAATRSAVVVLWVAVAYVVLALVPLAALLPGPGSPAWLAALAGVAVGAVPGCGVQLVWTGLYLEGSLPLAGLLANAVAQDGDALLPLLAADRRAAVLVTVATSVPALALGLTAAALTT